MTILAALLVATLTRAEMIERFRAPVLTRVNGLVETFADCPADMREAYQAPVAQFVADLCRTLYRGANERERHFTAPGLAVHVGDVRTNLTAVVAIPKTRADGSRYTLIYLPAPEFSDLRQLRLETVKAFAWALDGETLDDAAARRRLRAADPALKAADERELVRAWREGRYEEGPDDEHYLRLARSVLEPGHVTEWDVLNFASRLQLYPECNDAPFGGRFASCTFREAVDLAPKDARVRLAAFAKAPKVVAFGGGRGPELLAAAEAYSAFLYRLACQDVTREQLLDILDLADRKLNVAQEEARKAGKETLK